MSEVQEASEQKHGPAKGAARRGFGRIRKLPSGNYQAAYTLGGRVYAAPDTFTAKYLAEGWLGQEARAVKLGIWVPPERRESEDARPNRDTSTVTFGEFAEEWLAKRRSLDPDEKGALRPSSSKEYGLLLKNHLIPQLGSRRLDDLTPAVIQDWHRRMGAKRLPRARAKAYSLLRTILTAAVADKRYPTVKVNPCQIDGAGRVKRAKDPVTASEEELATIVADMPERLRLAVLLGCWGAMRYGEVFELRRKDVEFVKDGDDELVFLHVRRGVVWVKGEVVIGEPKTSEGKRVVVLPPHLTQTVKEHLSVHVGRAPNSLLFPAERGGNLRPSGFQNAWHHARHAAGRDDLKFHHLRHTGAVWFARAGATIADLQARLGHATPATAMIYQSTGASRQMELARSMRARPAG
ncbi:MAG TPA: site-specific integrase [Propionibacteriaceae bacterium]|nr:site-specific integrase [Propionibacteriaceae bacterium]